MKYLLFLYDREEDFHEKPAAEQEAIIAEHMAYSEALRGAGAMIGGNPLDNPNAAKSIRSRTGGADPIVEDGPFMDSKEQLGGYYLIEAPDLDAAIDWAAKCPVAATGVVEVRPVWEM